MSARKYALLFMIPMLLGLFVVKAVNRPLFDILTFRGMLLHRYCRATILSDDKPLENVLCFLKEDRQGEETIFLLFTGGSRGPFGLKILPHRLEAGWTPGGPEVYRHLYENVWAVAAAGKKAFAPFAAAEKPDVRPNAVKLPFTWMAADLNQWPGWESVRDSKGLEVRFD